MERTVKQTRSLQTNITATRAEQDDEMYIEGYFAVFNRETELFPGAFEEIAPEAFNDTLSNDIRALINHDTSLVLGRNKAGTLELKVDSRGLWGRIKINPRDSDAVNLYERVKRGDVDQCSFGFNIIEEETEFRDDGTVKWRLKKVDLHEVSVVTFPAYEDTSVQARMREYEQHKKRQLEQRKMKLKERVRDGVASINVDKKNRTTQSSAG
ncbi:HK97 family phage prohead protease [Geobacillus kaustophilus]|uniref:HK97 family phage prohead protease n=1 Tax=Geobacillus kaustophilus TaxID=1462 RepID=UPI0005CD4100|nr:HK97 family phage prohead protease [Geobacillus kaustophilus]